MLLRRLCSLEGRHFLFCQDTLAWNTTGSRWAPSLSSSARWVWESRVFITTAGSPNLFALVILGSTVMCGSLWAGYSGSSHLEASDHQLRTLYLNYFSDALSWDSPFLKPFSADLSERSSAFLCLSSWPSFLKHFPTFILQSLCPFFKITVFSIYPNG